MLSETYIFIRTGRPQGARGPDVEAHEEDGPAGGGRDGVGREGGDGGGRSGGGHDGGGRGDDEETKAATDDTA